MARSVLAAKPVEEPADGALSPVAREVLVTLERLFTRAAIGAARTAVRLGGIVRRHEAIEENAHEIDQVTARLRTSIEEAARAAKETADTSHRVTDIVREGREVSGNSLESIRRLVDHSQRSNDRLRSLLVEVGKVAGVSRVIDGIAARTRFLSLNASIEAARAGPAGLAFAVVAGEVRELAKSTALQTKQIDELMRGILADLEPTRAAMEESRTLAAQTAERVEAVDRHLATVNELTELASSHVDDIARELDAQSQAMGTLAGATQNMASSIQELRAEVRGIADASFAVASVTDEGHHELARIDIDTMFHHGLTHCRELAERTGRVLTELVARRRVTLDQMLDLEYREIRGSEIQGLARLFDVRKVPATGFTPPKYHTAYDSLVDEELQKVCDEVLGRDARLLFALPIDLNSYGPIHNRKFTLDWTGVPEKDLAGNRIKRFFTDNSVLVRGARVGLFPEASKAPERATRMDFARAGCVLSEKAGEREREAFLVQTYARDTGAMVSVITVPIFVSGQRWGAGLIGWSEDAG